MHTHRTDRRCLLRSIGRASLAGLLAPGMSLLRSDHAKATQEVLISPPEIRSRNGELNATLTASPSSMRLGDAQFPGFLYNDSYLPPLLRIRLGDVMRVRLRNNLPEGFTNLHFHGMSVSPRARSDNVFIHVLPGHEFEYEVVVPGASRQDRGCSGITRTATALSPSKCWAAYRVSS
jgi:suppressor of ftsI